MTSIIGEEGGAVSIIDNNYGAGGSATIDASTEITCKSVTADTLTANTSITVNETEIKDNIINISSGNTADTYTSGLMVECKQGGTLKHSALLRKAGGMHYLVGDTATTITKSTDPATLVAGNLTLGTLTATSTAEASSSLSGAIVISGGLGVGKDINVSGMSIKSTFLTPEMFSAVGDGITDDTAALHALITASINGSAYQANKIYGQRTKTYYTPALTNLTGAIFDDSIRIKQGNYLYNSYAHNQLVFGHENLYGWYNRLIAGTASKIMFTGDSTTVGDWTTDFNTFYKPPESASANAPFAPPKLIEGMIKADGYPNITIVNNGHSSMAFSDWRNTYLTGEKSQSPNLWVVRYGLNDMNNGTAMSTIMTDLRYCLNSIRTTFPLSGGTGIILMAPNSGEYPNVSNSQSDVAAEDFSRALKRAAIDYNCAFIDTYALWQNTRSESIGCWTQEGVHPLDPLNYLISSVLYDMMFPSYIRTIVGNVASKQMRTLNTSVITVDKGNGSLFYASGASLTPEYPHIAGKPILISGSAITLSSNRWSCPTSSLTIMPFLDGGQQGCIRFTYTPTYSGSPSSAVLLYWAAANLGGAKDIPIYHWTDGTILVRITNDSNSSILANTYISGFVPVSGTPYEFEFNYDCTNGVHRLFIDGVQLGSTLGGTGTRSPAKSHAFGANNSYVCYFNDLQIFNSVQHTANYVVNPSRKTAITSYGITTGNATLSSLTDSSLTSAGALIVSGGVGIAKGTTIGGITRITNTTNSNATDTGALIVSGGTSVNKTLYVGGAISSNDYIAANKTSDATDSLSGSLIVAGGAGISKNVRIGDGIYLPTSGGTASKLNYYEEHSASYSFGGIWSSNQSATVSIVRIGKIVNMLIPQILATANTASYIDAGTTPIPTQFMPSSSINFVVHVYDNLTKKVGTLTVASDGTILIYAGVAGTNFAGAGSSGVYPISVSWQV